MDSLKTSLAHKWLQVRSKQVLSPVPPISPDFLQTAHQPGCAVS